MIGIFDSGKGGQTILEACQKKLPQYKFVYFSDAANAPYGSKSPEEIFELTTQGIGNLFQQGCDLVVLGCNTASTVLKKIQQEWLPENYSDKKVLGIIVPTVEQITGKDWAKTHSEDVNEENPLSVGILATPHTAKSEVYEKEIKKRASNIKVTTQACDNLAIAIENEDREGTTEEIKLCVEGLLEQDSMPEAVLLGCTHYEHVAQDIAGLLPKNTELYRQPDIVAESLAKYLIRHPEIQPDNELG